MQKLSKQEEQYSSEEFTYADMYVEKFIICINDNNLLTLYYQPEPGFFRLGQRIKQANTYQPPQEFYDEHYNYYLKLKDMEKYNLIVVSTSKASNNEVFVYFCSRPNPAVYFKMTLEQFDRLDEHLAETFNFYQEANTMNNPLVAYFQGEELIIY